jgi:hypothetical protein
VREFIQSVFEQEENRPETRVLSVGGVRIEVPPGAVVMVIAMQEGKKHERCDDSA